MVNNKDMDKLIAFEMLVYRRMKRNRNLEVRTKVENIRYPELSLEMRMHMIRHHKMQRQILEGKVDGKTHEKEIENDLTGTKLYIQIKQRLKTVT